MVTVGISEFTFGFAFLYEQTQQNWNQWQQHSEPKRRTKSFFGKEIESLYRESARDWRPIDVRFSLDRFERTVGAVRELMHYEERRIAEQAVPLLEFEPARQSRGAVLARTSEILAVVFGLTMVIVGRPNEA
jgi:hypothetical protein